jgi:hypothetical protein
VKPSKGISTGRLELGGELDPERPEEVNRFGVGHQRSALRGVEVGPERGGRVHVRLERRRVGVARVHFAGERPELGEGDVGGAAFRARLGIARGRLEARGAVRGELGREDARRGVQVVLGVAADELEVLGEGHVALEDPRTHPGAGAVALGGVLGEEERRTAVRDREVGARERRIGAGGEPVAQRPVRHRVDEERRPGADLDAL